MTKPPDPEAQRIYADHLLPRYVRVVQCLEGDVIEIAPRQGHRTECVLHFCLCVARCARGTFRRA
jgi:hypothetical protein